MVHSLKHIKTYKVIFIPLLCKKMGKENKTDAEIFGQYKIFDHPDKLNNWKLGKSETLVTAKIDMTNECDSYCEGCPGGRLNKSNLTKEQAFYVVDQLSEFGLRGLVFSGGGDASLNPATPDTIKYAKSKGLDIGFITNGLSLEKKLIETIVKDGSWCRISLDADSPELYKRSHGLGIEEFNRVLSNIQKLCDIKKSTNSECTIGVGYLTRSYAVEGMFKATQLTKDLGVDYIQFRPPHGDFSPIEEQLKECEKLGTENFKVLSSEQKYSRFNDEDKRPYETCPAMNFLTVIDADMNVKTCCHARGRKGYTLGNLKNNSFREIWENRGKNPNWQKVTGMCPMFCAEDTLNRVLLGITTKKRHSNFL